MDLNFYEGTESRASSAIMSSLTVTFVPGRTSRSKNVPHDDRNVLHDSKSHNAASYLSVVQMMFRSPYYLISVAVQSLSLPGSNSKQEPI